MAAQRAWGGPRVVTLSGLVVGAIGIAILWGAGVPFPFYPPPGLVILLVGALGVGLAPWRWGPGAGAFLGLFVLAGFLISGGLPNLVGGDGNSVLGTPNPVDRDTTGTLVGTWVQLLGASAALLAGVVATRDNYRRPADVRGRDPPAVAG